MPSPINPTITNPIAQTPSAQNAVNTVPIGTGNGNTGGVQNTPVPQPTTSQPTVSDLYGGAGGLDAASAAALAAKTALYDPTTVAANEATTRASVLGSFQSQIDALDQAAAEARARITTNFAPVAAGRVGGATAIEARRGLLGSDFGQAQTDTVNQQNTNDLNSQISASDATYASQKTALMQFITGEQDKEITLRNDASTKGADAKIAEITDRQTRAQASALASVKAMIAAGISDPTNPNYKDGINKIAATTGLTTDEVTALYGDTKKTTDAAALAAQQAAADLAKSQADAAAAGRTSIPGGDKVIGPDGKVVATNPKIGTTTDAFGNPTFYTESGGTPGANAGSSTPGTPPVTLPPNTPPTPDKNNSGLPIAQTINGKTYDKNGDPTTGAPSAPKDNPNVPFAQYGLLSKTDFNPSNQVDQMAQKYLDAYLKSGDIPSARSALGTGIKAGAVAQVDSRVRDLYFKATGQPLPSPKIIQGYLDIINANNQIGNNLKVQEGTVTANVDLSLSNMKTNNLDSAGFRPLNDLINTVQDAFLNPATAQLLAQNTTIQQELGSLLAVKNAGGTTVFDKMSAAGIIQSGDSEAQVKAKVGALIKEAGNFATSLESASGAAYKQTDPLLQDPNNPARAAYQNGGASSSSGSTTDIGSLRAKYNY